MFGHRNLFQNIIRLHEKCNRSLDFKVRKYLLKRVRPHFCQKLQNIIVYFRLKNPIEIKELVLKYILNNTLSFQNFKTYFTKRGFKKNFFFIFNLCF